MIQILRNFKLWRHWRSVRKGKKPIDGVLGPGYYIKVGLLSHNPIGQIQNLVHKNGKKCISELISYETFWDPNDMIKESNWHVIGYVGEKAIKDCETFAEFLSIYGDLLKDKNGTELQD